MSGWMEYYQAGNDMLTNNKAEKWGLDEKDDERKYTPDAISFMLLCTSQA